MVDILKPFVHLPDFLQSIQDVHFSFAVISLVLKILHSVCGIFKLSLCSQDVLSMLDISPWLIVTSSSMLTDIIMVLGISFHGDLCIASCTLEVEAINLDAEVVFIITGLLSHVKLRTDVQKVATSVTPDTHREHHTDIVLLVLLPLDLC